uniref:hypothetical protein n=1 Tax=Arthrobacter sp. H5 TaxID=1267973 RepID=UPI0020A64319
RTGTRTGTRAGGTHAAPGAAGHRAVQSRTARRYTASAPPTGANATTGAASARTPAAGTSRTTSTRTPAAGTSRT